MSGVPVMVAMDNHIQFFDVHELVGTNVAIRAWDGHYLIVACVRRHLLEDHLGPWDSDTWRNAISGKPWPEICARIERKFDEGVFQSRSDGWIEVELTEGDIAAINPESWAPSNIVGSFRWVGT
jgi:hypothetical protein